MGFFKKLTKAATKAVSNVTKEVKKTTPKVTIGKDIGAKNVSKNIKKIGKAGKSIQKGVGKGAGSLSKSLGKAGSKFAKTLGKGTEGVVANTGDIAKSLAKGDFKGVGKEALELVQSGKDIAKGMGSAALTSSLAGATALGEATGDKNIKGLTTNVEREGQKGITNYGDAAFDLGANIASTGTYGAAKSALSGLSEGGIGGVLSGKGLQDAALTAAGSYAGLDPNMVKMGMSATQGDLKGAALSGLGVGEDASKLIRGFTGGNMDFKKMALEKLGSMGGVDPKLIESVASGKIDPMKAFQATGIDPKALLGDMGSKFGLNSFTQSPEAQEALEMGRSAGRTVASVDAYAKDAQNAAMDMQAKALQTAQGYKIKPGESLGAIAKRMGMSVEELKAANPQIKDINKIAAGANLNIPGATARGVVESGQVSQQQFDSARAFQDWSKQQTGYVGKEKKAFMKDLFDKRAAGQISNDDFVKQMESRGEKGFLDKAKDFFGGASDAVGSAVDKAKEFAAKNKTGIGLAADVTAATLGYKAGEEGRTAAAGLAKEQLADLQSAGKQFEQMRYDPTRYKQEREFIEQRIAGGGITPQEKLMQQQGDLRAARAGAAARMAGVEQQARLGGRGMAGSALAASLAGGQSVMGEQAATNLQREASASQRLEQDIQRGTNLSRQQTSEEAELAKQQGEFGLTRAQQTGSVRGDLGNLEMGRGAALQNLYGRGADFVKQGLGMLTPQTQSQQPTPQTQPPVSQPPYDPLKAKADGARRLSQRGQTQVPQTNVPKPATPPAQFNQQNQRPQPGAGLSQGIQQGQQAVQKVQSTIDEAKKKADEIKKNPLGAFGVKL